MKIVINGFNILDHNQWVEENMYYKAVIAIVILYSIYLLILFVHSYLINSKKVSYTEVILDDSISSINSENLFSSLHEIAKNQKIIIHIIHTQTIRLLIGTQNKNTLDLIQSFLESQFKAKCSRVSNYGNYNIKYASEFKIKERVYPIRTEDRDFFQEICNSFPAVNEHIALTYIIHADSWVSRRLHKNINKVEEGTVNDRGIRYVSPQNKIRAELLTSKNQYPLFLSRVIIQTETTNTLKSIRSRFKSLQTSQTRVYFGGIKNLKKNKLIEWLRPPLFYEGLYVLPHIYLNAKELGLLLSFNSLSTLMHKRHKKTPQNEMFTVG